MRGLTYAGIAVLGAVGVFGDEGPYNLGGICLNDQLMRWYDEGRGLWNDGSGTLIWWQSPVILETMLDLCILDGSVNGHYGARIADAVFRNAPRNRPYKSVAAPYLSDQGNSTEASLGPSYEAHQDKHYAFPTAAEASRHRRRDNGFTNRFYDDEGWWALAFVRAYDLTRERRYLDTSIGIWNDMKAGWNRHRCGGIPWNKDDGQAAVPISNGIFMQLSAALSNRVDASQKNNYLNAAKDSWSWFQNSGLISKENLIYDEFDSTTCRGKMPYMSYSNGVVIGGLTQMYAATGDTGYLNWGAKIADGVVRPGSLLQTSKGMLGDVCDRNGDCTGLGDSAIYKGVLMKNLKELYKYVRSPTWKAFIEKNAKSIWENDLKIENGGCYAGVFWGGPFKAQNPNVQSSALDCYNAAILVSKLG